MNPLMRLGEKRPLKMEDLPALGNDNLAQVAVERFRAYRIRHTSLWRALLASEIRPFMIQFCLATLSTGFGLAGPYFLYRITGFIQSPGNQPLIMAFLFAVAFGLSTFFRALCDNHAWHMARKMSIRIKGVIVNEVYCKSLKRIPNGGSGSSSTDKSSESSKQQRQ
ncbi:hypothetical protein BDR26DRAFT_136801 [Obelidium mucronatum]|nr:hypothetical protein BDR26DRAFT_136801 [Obelidium mucronatum]